MKHIRKKYLIIAVFAVVLASGGLFLLASFPQKIEVSAPKPIEVAPAQETQRVIGTSVERRKIEVYTYGNGPVHLLFVGGMHGGYEWNSVVLAYELIDHLKTDPAIIPKNLTIAIIPSLNPDGVYRITGTEGRFSALDIPSATIPLGTGRFNAHAVDLNRNFDCNWKPKSTWQGRIVSAGAQAFSEPETRALRDFVQDYVPESVIFWHSKSNGVYASQCKTGILPQTLDIMNVYASASGYGAYRSFDAYEISGDAEGWLASIDIPAITVELKTHDSIEWDRNWKGIEALFDYYKNLPKRPR